MLKLDIKKFLFGGLEVRNAAEKLDRIKTAERPSIKKKTGAARPLSSTMDLAIELMQVHGLVGWKIKLDHARRRAGQCNFSNQTISLSRLYICHAEPDHIRDTILHEIAHALVGPRHGHDAVWRQKAKEIGCTATRCHNLSFAPARWVMRCPNGCFAIERHRRKSGLVCVSCKAAVEFCPVERNFVP